jgi:putative hydrolase of the HAD superfamily
MPDMISEEIFSRLRGSRGIIFDLDNTLYPRERGVFDRIRDRISLFVTDLTGLGPAEVLALRHRYIADYGTTLGGLMDRHGVDPVRFMDFVHDVPVEELLGPEPGLVSFLEAIDLPKVVLTNASRRHAERVLGVLGVKCCFQGICDLERTGFLGKPHRLAYEEAAGILSHPLEKTVFLDDVPAYVSAGASYGSLAVHVGQTCNGTGHIHVERITDLAPVFDGMPWWKKTA